MKEKTISHCNLNSYLQTIVKIYTTSWPTIRNGNVYDKLTEQDKKKLENAAKQANDLFNSVNS